MRKIAVVTGTRAEYGILYWIIKGIQEVPDLELQLIVAGMHLSPEFGLTIREIERDGFPIAEKVDMLLSSDTETAIASSMGLGMILFAKAYERLGPDILVVLGDRFEILSAVAAAVPFRIPVAHIHGGETTQGAMDELFRHAITKMSHIHFPATSVYADRILQMGELPERVFHVGAPGLDNIRKLKLLEVSELTRDLGISDNRRLGVLTYHPVTLEKDSAEFEISELLSAAEDFPDVFWIITLPNADTGGRIILEKIREFTDSHPDRGRAFHSLGQLRYLSLLKNASVMLGNSSSGLLEAPSFELPVVNIGERQAGRVRGKNVIDVNVCKRGDIIDAVRKALSPEFRKSITGMKNPYGDSGEASSRIVGKLRTISMENNFIKKIFNDIQVNKNG